MLHSKFPSEIWLIFAGNLDVNVSRAASGIFAKAQNEGVKTIHFLIQSWGGQVGEGVFLHNLMKNIPVDVFTYNSGLVASAATTAYFGGKKRFVSANGAFGIHKVSTGGGNANALRGQTLLAQIEDQRTEETVVKHLKLTSEQLAIHAIADLQISAEGAIACGLATEVGDFAPKGPIITI